MRRLSGLASLLLTANAAAPTFEEFFSAANKTQWLVDFRRSVHMDPEIGLKVDRTAAKVVEQLKRLGIKDIEPKWAVGPREDKKGAGIVFDIRSSSAQDTDPVVLLRADMDALPINELADVPYKSKNAGVMHACGHDVHTTMLLGAVSLLHSTRDRWRGIVRIMFQPGEELYLGGKYMVEEGVLNFEKRPVKSAFALHVVPAGISGNLIAYPGTVLAGGREFAITIKGKGGHAGVPALTRDPVVAAAAFILQAQNLASRETFGAGVYRYGLISFTELQSDADASNVIPDEVRLSGVIRSATVTTIHHLASRLKEMVKALELSHRVTGNVTFGELIPPLHNDELLCDIHNATARGASRHPNFKLPFRPSGEYVYTLEDFAFVAEHVPSVMFGLTTGSGAEIPGHPPTNVTVHNAKFAMDERVIPRGAAFLAHIAVEELGRLTGGKIQDEL